MQGLVVQTEPLLPVRSSGVIPRALIIDQITLLDVLIDTVIMSASAIRNNI